MRCSTCGQLLHQLQLQLQSARYHLSTQLESFVWEVLATRDYFPWLFTSSEAVLTGGAGLQSIVAYIIIGCYYIFGLPLGILLGFGAMGIWGGMIGGICLQSFILIIITASRNWDKEVNEAEIRVKKWGWGNCKISDETETVEMMARSIGMIWLDVVLVLLVESTIGVNPASNYFIRLGTYDITGPATDVNMMGYANMDQKHPVFTSSYDHRPSLLQNLREKKVIFVNLDACMASQLVTAKVL